MAFTKSPTQDTHNTIRQPSNGTAFLVSNNDNALEPQTLNFIECFPLTEKQWNGESKTRIHKREAWEPTVCTGTVTTAGICGKGLAMAQAFDTYRNVFFAKQGTYYMCNYQTNTISTITTSTTPATAYTASFTNAVDNANARRIVALDAAFELKTWLEDGSSVTTTSLAAIQADGNRGLVFLNGYLFAVDYTGYKIYNSGAGGVLTTWATTDFLAAEQYADPIMFLDKHKNYLVAFGSESIEFFYDNAVEVGSPLARQESYSRRIGLYPTGISSGRYTAHIDDDIYFIGKKPDDSLGLFRVRNFQVEEIVNGWMQSFLNTATTIPRASTLAGLETVVVNNNPMIAIHTTAAEYTVLYHPNEDTWWMMKQESLITPNSSNWPNQQNRLGWQWFSSYTGWPAFLSQTASSSADVYINYPNFDHDISMTALVYSDTLDLGTNRWKQLARVDAIGDYGNNVLTLSYNPSPNYETSYVSCGTQTPSTNGFQNNISWYNLGAFRRWSFKFQMTGTDMAIHEAYDIEYNVGVA